MRAPPSPHAHSQCVTNYACVVPNDHCHCEEDRFDQASQCLRVNVQSNYFFLNACVSCFIEKLVGPLTLFDNVIQQM